MGYSWSFCLVQSLHVQGCLESSGCQSNSIVLDSRPMEAVCLCHIVSTRICYQWILTLPIQTMHEEQGPTTFSPTLGGVIDGKQGMIKFNLEIYWNIIMAFEYVCKHPVSSEMIRRLLGHAMVLLVLNRPARCCGAVQ